MKTTCIIQQVKYKPVLNLVETEKSIKQIKDFFQLNLSSELKLRRVTAPLFVIKGTGINDDLNGVEMPVSFTIKNNNNITAEIVQSLAKWKRIKLADNNIQPGYGLYTDMNAIRPDEELDNLHSLYVDQWDWEKTITANERNIDYLKETVTRIYEVIKRTEYIVFENHQEISPVLPEKITFIHSEDLLFEYPGLTPQEREHKCAEEYKAVFIIGIGNQLEDGIPHEDRAPDYDDWTTETINGYRGLNGDIILWNPVLKCAFEISSMGIRVDKNSLIRQLEIRGMEDRMELLFHKRLLNDELPLSIGGGIGQSRLCMYFLRKAHIGEVQSSIWPEEMIEQCKKENIILI